MCATMPNNPVVFFILVAHPNILNSCDQCFSSKELVFSFTGIPGLSRIETGFGEQGIYGFLIAFLCCVKKVRGLTENERLFRELLTGLTHDTTPEAMLSTVAEHAAKLVGADGVYIERLDAERQEIIATALHGTGLPKVGTRGPF